MNNESRWVTLKDGRRIKINDYMNDKIRNSIGKIQYVSLNDEKIEEFDKATKELKETLDAETINSLMSYAGIGHKEINETLELGKPTEQIIYSNINDIQKDINNIDNVMNKSMLNKNVICYRGTYEDFSNYKIGDTFNSKKFFSTSFKEKIALQRAKKKGEGGVVLEIRTSKNTKAIYMGDNFSSQNEFELLLNRGLKYKVIDIQDIEDELYGNYKKYVLKIVK